MYFKSHLHNHVTIKAVERRKKLTEKGKPNLFKVTLVIIGKGEIIIISQGVLSPKSIYYSYCVT